MNNQVLKKAKIQLVNEDVGSIHLVDGEKGGIGKSTFSRILIEFLQDQLKLSSDKMEIIDADKDQPLIGRTYAPQYYLKEVEKKENMSQFSTLNDLAKQIAMFYFSDNEKLLSNTDIIFELSLDKAVIVNLPGTVFSLVNGWLSKGVLEETMAFEVPIYKWFVTDGCEETIDTLKKSYELYENKLHHIIVKNRGLATTEMDWWAFDRDGDLQTYFELYKETTSIIALPHLLVGSSSYEAFKKRNLTLRDVSNREKARELGLKVMESARFRQWRNLSFESLKTLSWQSLEGDASEDLDPEATESAIPSST
ncbi:MAG: hypothetical protein WBM32_23115 [Crocosphaera sp.]